MYAHAGVLLLGSGFSGNVPPLGSQMVPGLSYQLLTVTGHNNWATAVLSLSLSLSLTLTHSLSLQLTGPGYNISSQST
jgi:hypothetical protein